MCDGRGCDECDNGEFQVNECPNKYCGELVNAIDLFDLYEHGVMPISGGSLDQSVWFVQAAKRFRAEESLAKTIRHNG